VTLVAYRALRIQRRNGPEAIPRDAVMKGLVNLAPLSVAYGKRTDYYNGALHHSRKKGISHLHGRRERRAKARSSQET
jgi:hypothetical protein